MATRPKAGTEARITKKSLTDLQRKVNADERLKKEFLRNPGAVFAREGIVLPAEKKQRLAEFLKQATVNNREAVISGIRPGAAGAEVEVRVTVTVRF
jgi:hypothetical protein